MSEYVSEYQYYDFVAIDRPLTAEQMADLRRRFPNKPGFLQRLAGAGL